jgi:hypothetical protein
MKQYIAILLACIAMSFIDDNNKTAIWFVGD